jgi:RNA polymerase sigma-70 factor (ECF subfamily)
MLVAPFFQLSMQTGPPRRIRPSAESLRYSPQPFIASGVESPGVMDDCVGAILSLQETGMADPDTELMLRVREGDRAAFRDLVCRHQRSVIHFCYRSVGDAWEAEDIAQKVFLQVYRSASRYVPSAKFSTWLFTIVRNTTRNELRRRQRHAADSLDELTAKSEESGGRHFADDRALSPSRVLQQKELETRLQQAIQSLPENQRTALMLLRYEEMSYDEIAQVIGCSVSATRSLLHRAKANLKEVLNEYLADS